MQCKDARELLDSFLAEELLVETNHELLRHLSACPDCKADLEARSRIRRGLKQAFAWAADLQVRPEFVDDMAARLRTTALTAKTSWQAGWLLAAAASVLLVAIVSAYFLRPRTAEIVAQAAGDHQNCAVKFALTEKPISLEEAAARYDPAYERLRTSPPDEVRTGAGTLHVADRHSCVFENRRFGHVVFRLDRHLVSLLMTRDDSARGASQAGLQQLPPVNDLSMASFSTPGHVVYIVSDLEDPAFRQVAESLSESRVAALHAPHQLPQTFFEKQKTLFLSSSCSVLHECSGTVNVLDFGNSWGRDREPLTILK
jgi:anti-sigma factor RsiW